MLRAGLDIGGTKCAAVLGETEGTAIRVIGRRCFSTADFPQPDKCLEKLCSLLSELLEEHATPEHQPGGVGISCGGPLDSIRGIIQSPPNLPGWDNIPATEIVTHLTGLPAKLENDANACALAEWKFGAGRGTENMLFLTFGTGMGAGIIVNGALYSGSSGMAGECGHIRLAENGPCGYGKNGSFEGFCSGGGIARLGKFRAEQALKAGKPFVWGQNTADIKAVTAKSLAAAADAGDPDARAIYAESGRRLGQGLAILMDILNPERIVIGSIFARSGHLLRPEMEKVLQREVLPSSLRVCSVVPSELGDAIGDIASLAITD